MTDIAYSLCAKLINEGNGFDFAECNDIVSLIRLRAGNFNVYDIRKKVLAIALPSLTAGINSAIRCRCAMTLARSPR